jgi:hypothetical protein
MAKKKVSKGKRRRSGLLGSMGLKELIFGVGLMTAGKIAVGTVAPGLPFQRQIGTVAGGLAAGVTGLPGKRLISFGLMDAGSDLVAGFMGGTGIKNGKMGGGFDF